MHTYSHPSPFDPVQPSPTDKRASKQASSQSPTDRPDDHRAPQAARSFIVVCLEWNGTEQNGTERNRAREIEQGFVEAGGRVEGKIMEG